ncbi:MAG: ABC transporter ATP-binding protein [Pseudomonadota bacterium]
MSSLLEIRDLHAYYGDAVALEGVNLDVRNGEVISLLGRNGAGKSTTLKALMGIQVRRRGSITLSGRQLIAAPPYEIARCGMAYCPEDRGIFAALSVAENLFLPPQIKTGGLSTEEIFSLFPNLHARRASSGTSLSGGEQQMLAIARILRTGATLLLLDEPSEGLAPTIVAQIATLVRQLKRKGYTILLVEQNLRFARALADRHYVMEGGRIIDELSNDAVGGESQRLEKYLAL